MSADERLERLLAERPAVARERERLRAARGEALRELHRLERRVGRLRALLAAARIVWGLRRGRRPALRDLLDLFR